MAHQQCQGRSAARHHTQCVESAVHHTPQSLVASRGGRLASCSSIYAASPSRQCRHALTPQRHARVRCRAAPSSITEPAAVSTADPDPPSGLDIQAKLEFLREDIKHLFDDQGIDAAAYDNQVEFRDPITQYSTVQGYLFNIKFLKLAFNPTLEVHEWRVVGPLAVLARWTMTMDLTVAKVLPLPWKPQLIFTGTSTYVFNPKSGRICKHIDTWDSVQNNQFFSLEAFQDFLRQASQTYSVPDLESPPYTVLRRCRDYQVRQYRPFLVAETPMDQARATGPGAGATAQFNPAGAGFSAFNTLASYIFGGNASSQKMEMTTPVFSDTAGRMQFPIGSSAAMDVSAMPAPLSGAPVTARMEQGGVFAVRTFPGIAGERDTADQAAQLMASLDRDGLIYDRAQGWKLARYNDPATLPPFRRNEVLVQLAEPYELWHAGELDRLVDTAAAATKDLLA